MMILALLLLSICLTYCSIGDTNAQEGYCDQLVDTASTNTVVVSILGDYGNVQGKALQISIKNLSVDEVVLSNYSISKYSGVAIENPKYWGIIEAPFISRPLGKVIPVNDSLNLSINLFTGKITQYRGTYYLEIAYTDKNSETEKVSGAWFVTLPMSIGRDDNDNVMFMVDHKKNIIPPDSIFAKMKVFSDSLKNAGNGKMNR